MAAVVLDACCGPKYMWFDRDDDRALYMDNRQINWRQRYPSQIASAFVQPDVIADFSGMPFPDETFHLVAFDPPHIRQNSDNGAMVKQYGRLGEGWPEILRSGFAEAFRVLRPDGVLIFKWSECKIRIVDVLKLTPVRPLFGHKSGKNMGTHWVCFIKPRGNQWTTRTNRQ